MKTLMLAGRAGCPARKILSAFIICLFSSQVRSQEWLPEFRVKFDYRPSILIGASLHDFLQFEHPLIARGCNTRVSIFYFRVNYQGQVDSLYNQGNFTNEEAKLISRNILATSGSWVLPGRTTSQDHCWFIYPCYVLGRLTDPCADDPQNQIQITILRNLLAGHAYQFDRSGRYLLPPNDYTFYSRR